MPYRQFYIAHTMIFAAMCCHHRHKCQHHLACHFPHPVQYILWCRYYYVHILLYLSWFLVHIWCQMIHLLLVVGQTHTCHYRCPSLLKLLVLVYFSMLLDYSISLELECNCCRVSLSFAVNIWSAGLHILINFLNWKIVLLATVIHSDMLLLLTLQHLGIYFPSNNHSVSVSCCHTMLPSSFSH